MKPFNTKVCEFCTSNIGDTIYADSPTQCGYCGCLINTPGLIYQGMVDNRFHRARLAFPILCICGLVYSHLSVDCKLNSPLVLN